MGRRPSFCPSSGAGTKDYWIGAYRLVRGITGPFGAGRGLKDIVYMRVGPGIGAGLVHAVLLTLHRRVLGTAERRKGVPESGYVSRQARGVLHGIYYVKYALLAINFTPCPANVRDFWNTPAVVQFGSAFVMLDRRYSDRSTAYRAC